MQRAVGTLPPPDIPQHPPAQKVAGRRMSATKPRPHIAGQKVPAPSGDDDDEPADYPRPPPPGTGEPHQHNQHEEEQPRREKKTQPEHKPQEDLYRKAEQNRPKKDVLVVTKGTTGSRISQPQSKPFGV